MIYHLTAFLALAKSCPIRFAIEELIDFINSTIGFLIGTFQK